MYGYHKIIRDTPLNLKRRSTRKRRIRLSEDERHAVAHAQYRVENANDSNPEVCFDYTFVQTLLSLIERLR